MFKCKAHFVDGSMEYVIVSTYDASEIANLIDDEYCYDRVLLNISDIHRISDSAKVMPVTIDVYDALEDC